MYFSKTIRYNRLGRGLYRLYRTLVVLYIGRSVGRQVVLYDGRVARRVVPPPSRQFLKIQHSVPQILRKAGLQLYPYSFESGYIGEGRISLKLGQLYLDIPVRVCYSSYVQRSIQCFPNSVQAFQQLRPYSGYRRARRHRPVYADRLARSLQTASFYRLTSRGPRSFSLILPEAIVTGSTYRGYRTDSTLGSRSTRYRPQLSVRSRRLQLRRYRRPSQPRLYYRQVNQGRLFLPIVLGQQRLSYLIYLVYQTLQLYRVIFGLQPYADSRTVH